MSENRAVAVNNNGSLESTIRKFQIILDIVKLVPEIAVKIFNLLISIAKLINEEFARRLEPYRCRLMKGNRIIQKIVSELNNFLTLHSRYIAA